MAIAELWELLEADPPTWHRFEPGATDAQLQEAEAALGVPLSRSYRSFLRRSNGAVLFGEERLLGVGAHTPPELDLVAVARALRLETPPLPPHLLPFAPTPDGAYCFLMRARPRDGEYPIVFWGSEEGEGEPTHEAFDEWLFELTEALRALTNEGQ